MNLLTINPYTTDASIFADLVPKVPPEVVEAVASTGNTVPAFIEYGLTALLIILIIQFLLDKLDIPYSKGVSDFVIKRRRIKTFGKEVANKDLILLLLKLITVLTAKYEFKGYTVEPLMKRTRKDAESLLEMIADAEPHRKIAVYDSIDVTIQHEKYLITELINYLESTSVPRDDVVEKTLLQIIEGFQKALTAYEEFVSTGIESELSLYEDVKKKELEREKSAAEFEQVMRERLMSESKEEYAENLANAEKLLTEKQSKTEVKFGDYPNTEDDRERVRVQRKPNPNYKPEKNSSESALVDALTRFTGENMQYYGFDEDNLIINKNPVPFPKATVSSDNTYTESNTGKGFGFGLGDTVSPDSASGRGIYTTKDIESTTSHEPVPTSQQSVTSSSNDSTGNSSSDSSSDSGDSGSCD